MRSLPPQPQPSWRIPSRTPLRGEIANAIARECAWIAKIARDGNTAIAVHRVRQSTKRLRALARLLRPCAGDELYKSWNTTLRDLARSLARERDVEVWVATYRRLASSNRKFTDKSKAMRAEVLQRSAENGAIAIQSALLQIAEYIIIFNEAWQRSLPKRISRASIRLGLKRAFRRAKKQYKIALQDTGADALHELRKRIKTVRSQVELLEKVFPRRVREKIGAWLTKTELLSKSLGHEHDLSMFLIITDELKNVAVSKRICEKARQKRQRLEKKSLAHATDIFEFDPSDVL